MSKGNLFFAMLLASLLGGAIAIGGYVALQPEQPAMLVPANQTPPTSFASYSYDTTKYVVPEGLNFVHAAKSSTEAVVHIRTIYEGSARNPTVMDDFFREYFGEHPGGGGPARGAGSGVIFTENGHIVTNNHVVDGATEIEVLLNDNRTYKAQVIGRDATTDLAVLKIEEKGLTPMKWGNSDAVQIGEWVLAVGNPYEFRSTVTAGIVSAKARNINILPRSGGDNLNIESFIQTDAAVNPGNSGGALVNLRGELVGINTAIISPTGAFAGYSFAVPASLVKKVCNDLVEFGTVQRALLGISIRDVDSELSEKENLGVMRGVYVQEVRPNTAARDAGLEVGDVIVAINGEEVTNTAELQEKVAMNRPGDAIDVSYIRGGKSRNTKATLRNQEGTTAVVEKSFGYKIEGAEVAELTEREKASLKIDGGVKLTVESRGKWSDAGIKSGFIITKVDKKEIRGLSDFREYLNGVEGEGILLEGIYPTGERAYYGIAW